MPPGLPADGQAHSGVSYPEYGKPPFGTLHVSHRRRLKIRCGCALGLFPQARGHLRLQHSRVR